MNLPDGEYTVRYGWTRRAVLVMWPFAVLVGVCLVPGALPPADSAVRVVGWVVAPFVVTIVVRLSLRSTAVLVGPKGITLRPLLLRDRGEFLPWQAIASVSLDRDGRGLSELTVLWRGTDSAPAPYPPSSSPALAAIDEYLKTQVDPRFVAAFRDTTRSTPGMFACPLDPPRLRAAIHDLAPQVHLFGDLGQGG
jgi:hypothetical protein